MKAKQRSSSAMVPTIWRFLAARGVNRFEACCHGGQNGGRSRLQPGNPGNVGLGSDFMAKDAHSWPGGTDDICLPARFP